MKYKLIKEYPDSPPLDTIMDMDNKKEGYVLHEEGWCVPKTHFQDHKFWEKVGDYEITHFIEGNTIVELRSDGYYHYPEVRKNISTLTKESALEGNYWKIHSVRRFSDGEVFTIGDRVKYEGSCTYDSFIIDEIIVRRDDKVILRNKEHTICELLNTVERVKKLFTTEDGMDIYEGDVCYSVVAWCPFKHRFTKTSHPSMIASDKKKYFSTEEKTWEWIKENKPKYSKKDIEDALKCSDFYHPRSEKVIDKNKFWECLDDAR